MLVNNYLSVAMFQLSVELECDSREEYLVETNEFLKQIENCLEVIREYGPDISLFPEMTYVPKFEKEYQELSRTRIIVAGSFYKECINTTVVFADGMKYEIAKAYASGAEPMARKISFVPPEEFLKEELERHAFWIKGKKIYILNCMEYYHTAYYIARNRGLNSDLFGIFAICSNSNTRVFEEETVCIHNHNERIYTFVLNCVGTYQGKKYADGKSYIYGPVSIHEKEWLIEEMIESKQNVSHILSMSAERAQFVFAKFVFAEELSRFGRSDSYLNNPRDIVVKDIRRE
ncbi:MAG: hypothetical protein J6B87_04855 [Clostridia bacterium]|nr:hypothetical protein [Clostridia bacterium]